MAGVARLAQLPRDIPEAFSDGVVVFCGAQRWDLDVPEGAVTGGGCGGVLPELV